MGLVGLEMILKQVLGNRIYLWQSLESSIHPQCKWAIAAILALIAGGGNKKAR